ncbi:MAG: AmmeMemoRadiSam system radical SAM enzyme, partial [Aigarchaeota archaeon]|nr:AmmeMemoRadiSam system radical SAM enzyme [Aigarchaeota archaeon]
DGEEQIRSLVERHLKELGPEAPLHFTRYYPAYEFSNPTTKVETLEKARQTAWKAGILFPYLGNVPGHRYENTYCPSCGELVIERLGATYMNSRLTTQTKCPRCRRAIPITGRIIEKRRRLPF